MTEPRADRPLSKRERRREEIVALASELLNRHGLQGLVLAEVAAMAGMSKANLTYYFRRKEDLAAACIERSFAAYDVMIADAADAATPRERLGRLVTAYFARAADAVLNDTPPLAVLSHIRTLDDGSRTAAIARYLTMLQAVARLLVPGDAEDRMRRAAIPGAEFLLVQLFWSAAWLGRYEVADYPDIARRLTALLADGLAGQVGGAPLIDEARSLLKDLPGDVPETRFFRAAIGQINEFGYRGASIDRISAAMSATKGAIYHHFASKDDLVLSCFRHSIELMWSVMRGVAARTPEPAERLPLLAAALTACQLGDRGPFLRATALSSLPLRPRVEVVDQIARVGSHIALIVTDAIAAGTIPAVEPSLAANAMIAAVNAADEIGRLVARYPALDPVRLCTDLLLGGVFAPPYFTSEVMVTPKVGR